MTDDVASSSTSTSSSLSSPRDSPSNHWPDDFSPENNSDILVMDIDSQSEDGLTSLSDSTFEIISHSSFQPSDEEARDDGTESLISFGMATPEDSLDGDEHSSPQEPHQHDLDSNQDRYPTPSSSEADKPPPQPPSLSASTLRQSDLSTMTITPTQSAGEWIKFQDPIRGVASGLIDITKPSKSDGAPGEESSSQHPHRAVRMTLSNKPLQVDGSIRIIFYTCYPELLTLKQPILEKLGQALFLSRASDPKDDDEHTMMNVVPISAFEENAAADVVLVPCSGLQIHVEDRSGSNLYTSRWQKGKISFWIRGGCVIRPHHTKIPDLFVFVHPGPRRPLHDLRSSLSNSEYLKRHGVPVLDICEEQWTPDALDTASPPLKFRPWRGRAVHVVYPTLKSQQRRNDFAMPIDYAALQHVEASDLNSNLGVITYSDRLADRLWSSFQHTFESTNFKPLRKALLGGSCLAGLYIFGLILAKLIGLALLYMEPKGVLLDYWKTSPKITPSSPSMAITSQPIPTVATQRTLPPPVAPLLLSAPKVFTKSKAVTKVVSNHRHCHRACSAAKIYTSSTTRDKTKKTPEFQILEAHDGRLFLQASKSLPRKWKTSANFVHAVQEGTPLEATFTTINDTTFELHLGESRSCGPIIVTVWPHQGQAASQTFQLLRPCPKATFQSIADSYAKALVKASSSIALTTSDLISIVHQHSSELYSQKLQYIVQHSTLQSRQIGNLAHQSLEQVQRLNRKVEDARNKFNAWGDEALSGAAKSMGTTMKHLGQDVVTARQSFNGAVARMKTQAVQVNQARIKGQAIVYQSAHTKMKQLQDGMRCGEHTQLPACVCKSRLRRKLPVHVKTARRRATHLRGRFANRGARFRRS